MAKISPMEIYRLLPGTNCKECDELTCMAFASKLIEREKTVLDCPPISEDKYREKREELIELMTPPVKEIELGTGENAVKIGGEEVMYRHELTYFNQTAFIIDVDDGMESDALLERIKKINNFEIVRVGQSLKLQGIAVRSKSNDLTKFGDTVLTAVEKSNLPIILCSYDPEFLEVGLEIAVDRKPLIYAATKDNLEAVSSLALKYRCPVVASSPGDIQGLIDIVHELLEKGIEEIVLDVGSYPAGERFGQMMEDLLMVRRMAIEGGLNVRDTSALSRAGGIKALGFPIIGTPIVSWLSEKDPIEGAMAEASLAASQILRYCDILILHSLNTWSILPLLTLRQNIYTDPRVPIRVDAKYYTIGSPNENSPVLLTTNFALTYYTVAGDIESSKVSCYLLVVDTEGLAVEPAMAGGKLTASLVKEAIEKSGISKKVNHKKIIIPAMTARISGDIEDETGWEVLVGPIDSSRIEKYLDENWNV